MALTNVTSEDAVGLTTFSGQIHFAREVIAGTSNEVSSSVTGQSLDVSEAGNTASLSDFSFSGTRTLSGLTLGQAGETFVLQLSTLSDPLAGQIVTTFSGTDMGDLDEGSVRVQAVDDSKLLLTITAADGSVSLDVDSDGDDSYEDTVTTNWDDLY
jgi:hypothetical protein